MKTYFCGSIRGGRADVMLYHEMIGYLKNWGTVLTEHVGDPKLTEQGNDGTPQEIWKRDTDWLRESDIVIAECSNPSLGVGYELAFAQTLGKPVYLFYGKTDGRLSAMLEGCPDFETRYYHSREELKKQLTEIMNAREAELKEILRF